MHTKRAAPRVYLSTGPYGLLKVLPTHGGGGSSLITGARRLADTYASASRGDASITLCAAPAVFLLCTDWTAEDVGKFLTANGLGEHAPSMEKVSSKFHLTNTPKFLPLVVVSRSRLL